MQKRYCIGLDFGTLSGRAVLVDVANGNEIATHITPYSHGVINEFLPDSSTKLMNDWALQHPEDYLQVLYEAVPAVVEKAGVNPDSIIGLGIDFTSCTMLPVDKNFEPLCLKEQFRQDPNSWVKLWKHHAAQPQADRINEVAEKRGEKFLKRYGGKISSEWLIPKILQILEESPEIYENTYRFMECGDWIVYKLTGNERKNSCNASCKGMWNPDDGYPSNDFLKEVNPIIENLVEEKLGEKVYPIGSSAGGLTMNMAEKLGLLPYTAVSLSNTDAHIAVPAVGVAEPGKIVMIIGTSTCHFVVDEREVLLDGICEVVKDVILPGYFGYEAGQSCVGDHFEWFVNNCVPESYYKEAEKEGTNIYRLLDNKASKLRPGQSGLLALDWWNGNRSTLVDANLSGLIIGATLSTKPEEIYRALIEATAFGTRVIIDNFVDNGIPIKEVYACGGISQKNPLLMQIYSDVINMQINVAATEQAAALGAAMYGAVAAGKTKGGFDDIFEASRNMASPIAITYKPLKENVLIYDVLFKEYKKLYDYFGKYQNDVMKVLKDMKRGR